MKTPNSEPLYVYSWSSRGNLGDDWIHSVASLVFENFTAVYEKRSPWLLGSHYLATRQNKRPKKGSRILLWGGGWLAGDQRNLRVYRRWSRHFHQNYKFFGFGLGIGPFHFFQAQWAWILSNIQQPIFVRCESDEHSGIEFKTELAADVVFLDQRISGSTNVAKSGTVFSLARYSAHWLDHNPSLTEVRYRELVCEIQKSLSLLGPCTFVEFDSGGRRDSSDSNYWSFLDMPVLKPKTVEDAFEIFQRAETVVASRLHAGILGALVGAKVLALSYHHKFESLREIGVEVIDDFSVDSSTSSISPRIANGAKIAEVRERAFAKLERLKVMMSLDSTID